MRNAEKTRGRFPEMVKNAAAALGKKLPGNGKKRWILPIAVVAVLILGMSKVLGSGNPDTTQTNYTQSPVEVRSIVSTLRGSGTLKPANSYTVTTLLQGEILSDDFEEGDVVEKDSVLYEIDKSNASDSMERAQLTLDQAQRSYSNAVDNSVVRTEIAGVVAELKVKPGDPVTQGQQVAVIRDSATMRLTVPFPSDDAQSFSVGQSATITLDGTFETLSGTIESISGSDVVGTGNMVTRNVTVTVTNPGGLGNHQAAAVSVNGVQCADSGVFDYQAESVVIAGSSGTVESVSVQEGQTVSRDQTLLTLGGKMLDDQIQSAQENLRSAQLSMESTEKQMEDYTITSPISGTIVEKTYKAGDTVESGKSLCVIYDLSYLEMTLDVDELDISYVRVGQNVQITADAVPGKAYTGEITKVSVAGTTASGGGTSYPVTIRIDDTDGLLPGMNVDAEIILNGVKDALSVPCGAVQRGDMVLVTMDSPSSVNALEEAAPEGYVFVPVQTGESDGDYIEIRSGLQEGDTVAYVPVVVGSTLNLGGFD